MPLGDLKPSQLFNEMKRVAGNSLGEAVLLDLWATRLPPHAQAAVIASRGDAADKITIADAIVDSMVLRKINAVDYKAPNAMAPPKAEVAAIDPIQDLKREIAELSRWLEKVLPSQKSFHGRSRSRSRGGEKQNSQREREPSIGPCWYHRRFIVRLATTRSTVPKALLWCSASFIEPTMTSLC